MKYLSGVSTLEYDPSKCTGCTMCVTVCPHAVFEMEGKKARIIDRDLCMECGACMRNCASGALTVLAGVGCASALIKGMVTGDASCGCSDGDDKTSNCC